MKKEKDDLVRWQNEKNSKMLSQYRFVRMKRICERWRNKNRIIYSFLWIVYHRMQIKYATEIPVQVEIGSGFKIRHLGGIVINPNVKIGNNVDILNGVLLGQQDRGKKEGAPIIGNDVFIGTNAIIVGKVSIGDNVLIAPGAYINFDVPKNSIVLGNPGKIIEALNATEGYIDYPYTGGKEIEK